MERDFAEQKKAVCGTMLLRLHSPEPGKKITAWLTFDNNAQLQHNEVSVVFLLSELRSQCSYFIKEYSFPPLWLLCFLCRGINGGHRSTVMLHLTLFIVGLFLGQNSPAPRNLQ